MRPSRSTQPYRKGAARQPGLAMKAMKRGSTASGFNPMDVQRAIAKGGDAPRQMAAPVAPGKGKLRDKLPGGLGSRKNATGNARDGGVFREVRGSSKSGVAGTFHVYSGGRRVFVADAGAKPRRARARSFANRAKMSG